MRGRILAFLELKEGQKDWTIWIAVGAGVLIGAAAVYDTVTHYQGWF